jgi:hypothetical protein
MGTPATSRLSFQESHLAQDLDKRTLILRVKRQSCARRDGPAIRRIAVRPRNWAPWSDFLRASLPRSGASLPPSGLPRSSSSRRP